MPTRVSVAEKPYYNLKQVPVGVALVAAPNCNLNLIIQN